MPDITGHLNGFLHCFAADRTYIIFFFYQALCQFDNFKPLSDHPYRLSVKILSPIVLFDLSNQWIAPETKIDIIDIFPVLPPYSIYPCSLLADTMAYQDSHSERRGACKVYNVDDREN